MTKNSPNPASPSATLGEAVTKFLISLPTEKRLIAQQEVSKFVRWYGEERLVENLSVPEIENYSEQITCSTTELAEKLAPVKGFLSFCYKQGFTKNRLASHIKVKKTTSNISLSSRKSAIRKVTLTPQGYAELESELLSLKQQRPRIIEEIQKAAADKDFRENAPLDAAKDYQGQVEARIKELESMLKEASVIVNQQEVSQCISMGDTVVICDLTTGERMEYKIVDPSEANPMKGKISNISPIGKALLGHSKGDEIQVIAPVGILPHKIEDVKKRS